MKIEIIGILDRGDPAKERLHLRILADCDIHYFLVFATRYLSPTSISTAPKNSHWFRSKLVKALDTVVLYTKSGTASEVKNGNGTTSHFEYWGLNAPVWTVVDDCAMVLEVNTWQTSAYGK